RPLRYRRCRRALGEQFLGNRELVEGLGSGPGHREERHHLRRVPGGRFQRPAGLHDLPHGGEEDEAEGRLNEERGSVPWPVRIREYLRPSNWLPTLCRFAAPKTDGSGAATTGRRHP